MSNSVLNSAGSIRPIGSPAGVPSLTTLISVFQRYVSPSVVRKFWLPAALICSTDIATAAAGSAMASSMPRSAARVKPATAVGCLSAKSFDV